MSLFDQNKLFDRAIGEETFEEAPYKSSVIKRRRFVSELENYARHHPRMQSFIACTLYITHDLFIK
jgi:hypothetical protein